MFGAKEDILLSLHSEETNISISISLIYHH